MLRDDETEPKLSCCLVHWVQCIPAAVRNSSLQIGTEFFTLLTNIQTLIPCFKASGAANGHDCRGFHSHLLTSLVRTVAQGPPWLLLNGGMAQRWPEIFDHNGVVVSIMMTWIFPGNSAGKLDVCCISCRKHPAGRSHCLQL